MSKKRKYRIFTWILFIAAVVSTGIYAYYDIENTIPDEIHYCTEKERQLEDYIDYPLITYSDDLEVSGNGSYTVQCKLGGVIPLKTVKMEKEERPVVYACGNPIGIYMETNGVLIVDSAEIQLPDGRIEEPAKNIVKAGDYIKKVNGKEISNKTELMDLVADGGGASMILTVRRKEETIDLKLNPLQTDDGTYKLGIWVRDNVQGIGTLTYVRSDGTFGALGHGISDVDTGELLSLEEGELYQAEILDIIKGLSGSPGELRGVIRYRRSNYLGKIEKNTNMGISGTLDKSVMSKLELELYEVAMKQEIKEGSASVLCSVDGTIEKYGIEIEDIELGKTNTNKCFKIRVTDKNLLQKTGGIVQGMSGSPILQDGKIVGAVTHVLVNDPTRGYGIFIENMLEH